MGVAEKLERLARFVPGVGGYQDKERSRETDKTIRLHLSGELERLKGDIEEVKKYFIEEKNLSPLPALDGLSSKLDRVANLVKYAGRGYRGFFDTYKHDLKKIQKLYDFDLDLMDRIPELHAGTKKINHSKSDPHNLQQAMKEFETRLDEFEIRFGNREEILKK